MRVDAQLAREEDAALGAGQGELTEVQQSDITAMDEELALITQQLEAPTVALPRIDAAQSEGSFTSLFPTWCLLALLHLDSFHRSISLSYSSC